MATKRKTPSATARDRQARLLLPGYPLKGNKRLQPFKGVEVEGTNQYQLVTDRPPSNREYNIVDQRAAKRKARKR